MHAGMLPKTLFFAIVLTGITSPGGLGQTAGNGSDSEITLTKCWDFPVESGRVLAAGATRIFVGSDNAKVESLASDGKKLWATELGGEIASNLIASDAGLYLVTSIISDDTAKTRGGTLRFMSKETGVTGWAVKISPADSYSLGLVGDAVIAVTSKGAIESFDAKTGAQKWRRELAEGFTGEPRFNGVNVYVASTTKQIFTVSLSTGEVVSVKKLQFAPTAVAEITGEVFTGDERGNVALLGKGEKVDWNFKSGGKISDMIEVGSRLLAASNDNFVYLFVSRNGDVAWKRRLPERISHIGVVDDKFALVSAYEERGAMLIDLSSGRTVGQVTLAADEFSVSDPVSSNGKIFVLTNNALYGYSTAKCQ